MKSKLTLIALLFPSFVFAHDFVYTTAPTPAQIQSAINNGMVERQVGEDVETNVVNLVGCSTGNLSGCPGSGTPTADQVVGGVQLVMPVAIAGSVLNNGVPSAPTPPAAPGVQSQ